MAKQAYFEHVQASMSETDSTKSTRVRWQAYR
jgi:hypothetical protein